MAVAVAGKVGKEGRSRARETEMEGGGQGWSKARWGRVEQSRRDGKSSATEDCCRRRQLREGKQGRERMRERKGE
jgi:hypothetical protein